MWDAASGIYYRTLSGHAGGVSTVAWAPDSRRVVSASDDSTAGVWDVETGARVGLLSGHAGFCFAADVTGEVALTGGFDGTVKLWDLRSGRVARSIVGHSDPVTCVHFNEKDAGLLLSSSFDGLARVWDLRSGHCLRTIVQDSNPPVGCAKFSPNGKFVLTASFGGLMQLWSYAASSPKPLKRYKGHVNERFCVNATFLLSPQSGSDKPDASVLCGSENGSVFVWDLQTKKVTQQLRGHTAPVVAVDAHPHNGSVASGELAAPGAAQHPVIRIWRPAEGDRPVEPLYIAAPATRSSSMFKLPEPHAEHAQPLSTRPPTQRPLRV